MKRKKERAGNAMEAMAAAALNDDADTMPALSELSDVAAAVLSQSSDGDDMDTLLNSDDFSNSNVIKGAVSIESLNRSYERSEKGLGIAR